MRLVVLPVIAVTFISCDGGNPTNSGDTVTSTSFDSIEAVDDSLFDALAGNPSLDDNANVADFASHLLMANIVSHKDSAADCENYYNELDIVNGYAEVGKRCGPFKDDFTFNTWRTKDGKAIVGMSTKSGGQKLPSTYNFAFYEAGSGVLEDVTNVLLPMDKIDAHKKEMSRRMREKHNLDEMEYLKFTFFRMEEVVNVDLWFSIPGIALPLFTLEWKDDKFEIKKKFDKIPKTDKY